MQNSKKKIQQIIAICMGHFMNDVFMNLLIPLSFLFKIKMGLTYAEQAMIGTVIISLGSFGQPLVGHAVDKKGKSGLLIIAILWIGVLTSIAGFINHYYLLLFIAGLGALGSALYHPLGSSLVINLLGKTKGAGLSIFITVGSFAIGFAPFVAIPLATKFGLKSLVLFIIPTIITAAIMYFFKVHEIKLGVKAEDDKNTTRVIDKSKISWVASLITVSVIRSLIFRSFLLAFGVQVLLMKGVEEIVAGIALSLLMWTTSAGTFAGGYLSDKYGGKNTMIFSSVVVTLLLILLIIAKGVPSLIIFILIGFGAGLGNAPNITMAQEIIPRNTSLATGLIFGLGGGLGGVIMYFYGMIADSTSLFTAVTLLLIPVIIMDILIFLNPIYEDGEIVTKLTVKREKR